MIKNCINFFLNGVQLCFGIVNAVILSRNTDMKNTDLYPWECLICVSIVQIVSFLGVLPDVFRKICTDLEDEPPKKETSFIEKLFVIAGAGCYVWCLVVYFNSTDINTENEFGKMYLANVIWILINISCAFILIVCITINVCCWDFLSAFQGRRLTMSTEEKNHLQNQLIESLVKILERRKKEDPNFTEEKMHKVWTEAKKQFKVDEKISKGVIEGLKKKGIDLEQQEEKKSPHHQSDVSAAANVVPSTTASAPILEYPILPNNNSIVNQLKEIIYPKFPNTIVQEDEKGVITISIPS